MEKKKTTKLKAPQVVREGTKKIVFTNFADICYNMNRDYADVKHFISTELGTDASLDANMRLIVKKKFSAKDFEHVIRRYMNEYVLCDLCKSPETLLSKDQNTRLISLNCKQCHASKSVSGIKNVFAQRTDPRKA